MRRELITNSTTVSSCQLPPKFCTTPQLSLNPPIPPSLKMFHFLFYLIFNCHCSTSGHEEASLYVIRSSSLLKLHHSFLDIALICADHIFFICVHMCMHTSVIRLRIFFCTISTVWKLYVCTGFITQDVLRGLGYAHRPAQWGFSKFWTGIFS